MSTKSKKPLDIFLQALEANRFDQEALKAHRLLEAAPDLLAACQRLVAMMQADEKIMGHNSGNGAAFKQAAEAIDKAVNGDLQ